MLLLPIINNISMVIALSVAYIFLNRYFKPETLRLKFTAGLVFGLFSLAAMHNAVQLEPGVIFDGRSIILAVAGLFGGPLSALVSATIAMAYRVHIGGTGMFMGVLVIVESALLGVIFHYLIKRYQRIAPWVMYLTLGVSVHLIMLILMLTLPREVMFDTFNTMVLPILLVFPVATLLVCLLFRAQESYYALAKRISESEERFRQLFYESQVVFLVIDPQTKYILDANHAAIRFYGYSLNEIRKLQIDKINILPSEDVNAKMQLALSGQQNIFEFTHRLANGEDRNVRVYAGPVKSGSKVLLYSIVTDITEQIKAEKKLREGADSYRGLFDAVKDSIYIQDRNGVFLDVNAGAERMYGYSKEEIIGKTPEFLGAPGRNNNENIMELVERAYLGESIGFEYWGRRKNGEVFPQYVRLFLTRYFGQNALIAISHDITEAVVAKKELEDSRSNLNALINVSEDVIVLLDKHGHIITHNKSFARFYPSKNNFEGDNIFQMPPDDISRSRIKYFQTVLDNRQILSFEEESNGRNWWMTFYPVLDKFANVERVALYARDVSYQKKTLQLEKNLDVARQSAFIKQQFLANMSHEMRTPMNGIVGMTGLLVKTPLTEEQSDFVDTIKESSETLLSLINDILDLARFESGKMPLNYSAIHMSSLKNRVLSLFQHSAASKGLAFNLHFHDNLPAGIVTDEKRLMQVIVNLVGNALKFTYEGSVSLQVEKEHEKNGLFKIRFTIKDTGIGIDPAFLPRVFDEFSQYDDSRTRNFEGTGLGLSISRRIVEMMEGEIGVESEKGAGSKFWFTIKVRKAEEDAIKDEKQTDEFTPLGLSILMVEDQPVNRKVAALILKSMGCHVEVAENGLIGVEKVLKNTYDVVLMDIQMPVMDGISAVKTLRATRKKLPVIIGLSAEAMSGDAEKYIAEGLDDYITKPLVPAILYEKLLMVKKP